MSPGPYPHAPGAPRVPAQSGKAIASLVLGLLSIVCCGGLLTGIPAIVFGLIGRRDIMRSEGALDGTGVAVTGVVTGAIGTFCSVAYIILNVAGIWAVSKSIPTAPTWAPPPTLAPTFMPSTGKVHVIQLRKADGPLAAQLASQASSAKSTGNRVMAMTVAPDCKACTEIQATFPDFTMGLTLEKVTVARVDVTEFGAELGPAGMAKGKDLPWFFLVDDAGKVTDAMSADEWDDNRPENISPVMDQFLDGTLMKKHK